MGDDSQRNKSPVFLIALSVVVGSMLLCGGIGAALILPAIQASREAARRQAAAANVKAIGGALHRYHNTSKNVAALAELGELVAFPKLFENLDSVAEVGTDPAFEKLAAERQFKANMVAHS